MSASGNGILVDVRHDLDPLAMRASLQAVNAVIYREVGSDLVEAFVPAASVGALEHRAGIQSVELPPQAFPVSSSAVPATSSIPLAAPVVGEEVAKTRADVWHLAGYTGAGVKVGIIDFFDSTSWNPAQTAGEVPVPAGVICRSRGTACDVWSVSPGARHGTAVAEILHEMAPDARLYLAYAKTPGDYENVLDYFAAHGVKIVSHSLTWAYDGPGDGTGPAADIVAYAVSKGMVWLNAAGNSGEGAYWRAPWVDANANGWLDFVPGDELMRVTCSGGLGLRWNDWGTGPRTNYDVYVWDDPSKFPDISLATAWSTNDQDAGASPLESWNSMLSCTSGGVDYLAVGLWNPDTGAYDALGTAGNGTAGDILEIGTSWAPMEYWSSPYSATIPFADTASPGAVSVGAIDPPTGILAGGYSSRGPTNDNRIKPDLSAASGIASFTFGTFSGTSASAPAAAGAAALIIQAGLAGTPAQVKSYLMTSATIDRGAVGADNIYGSGELILPNPPRSAPVAIDDMKSLLHDTTVNIAVLANDSDADGDSLWVDSITPASHGTAVINGDGVTVDYTPDAAYTGPDSFTYTVSDGALTDVGTVTISVTADSPPPPPPPPPSPPPGPSCDPAPDAGFTDVPAGSAFDADIDYIGCEGIAQGTGDGTYDPLGDVTRWQMALFLMRTWSALGLTMPSGADQGFTDTVGLPADYQLAINQLAQLGITRGTAAWTFSPDGQVTRWEMALFLMRLMSASGYALPAGSDGFSDTLSLPADAQMAINQLAQLGITIGTTAETFTPYGLVTREQMAAFLARTMRLLVVQ